MAKPLLPDELWELVEPLPPRHEPSPKGGHPRVGGRVCLTGLLFVPKTGIPWADFPREMGCCGMTLLNRLREWQAAGAWRKVHELLLAKPREADLIATSGGSSSTPRSPVRRTGGRNGAQPRGPQ